MSSPPTRKRKLSTDLSEETTSPPTTPESSSPSPARQLSFESTGSSPSRFPGLFKKHKWNQATPVKIYGDIIQKSGAGDRAALVGSPSGSALGPRLMQAANNIYRYNRIPRSRARLLIIKPGAPDDDINVTLLTVADDDLGTDDYPYIALSYHWGEGKPDKTIIIQDDPTAQGVKKLDDLVLGLVSGSAKEKRFFVKPNLYDALKHLRHREDPVSAWIDALCINQSDEVEKSEQVSKMARIYSSAYNVCIWLGSDEVGHTFPTSKSSSAVAMNFIPQAIDPEMHQELLYDESKTPQWASILELLKWSW